MVINKTFIKACLRQEVDHIPVWMMRQAGRYLKSYRDLRSKHPFQTMYKTPELVAQVTLLPLEVLNVDCAILFSDILVIPEAMGMELHFKEKQGPVFPNPVYEEKDINKLISLNSSDVQEKLGYVTKGIGLVKKNLPSDISLIGFSGAPWTIACYMTEGHSSSNFSKIKCLRYQNPKLLHELLHKISESVIEYAKAQIQAGAEAIQLFDTWAGIIDEEGFVWFILPYIRRIISEIKSMTHLPGADSYGVPVIYFAKGVSTWLEHIKDIGADVLGLDWGITLDRARKITGDGVALQGNLDPNVLYAEPDAIYRFTKEMIDKHGKKTGYIANLGHGIFPDIPLENARAFVDCVREEGKL